MFNNRCGPDEDCEMRQMSSAYNTCLANVPFMLLPTPDVLKHSPRSLTYTLNRRRDNTPP